ncbi:hypothetical protein C8Q75DRAFT_57018 [Abortiporus biennis]|nr:hypothetical protein C8Q75DRAFT_57018 [Abortiporus biennis]
MILLLCALGPIEHLGSEFIHVVQNIPSLGPQSFCLKPSSFSLLTVITFLL